MPTANVEVDPAIEIIPDYLTERPQYLPVERTPTKAGWSVSEIVVRLVDNVRFEVQPR